MKHLSATFLLGIYLLIPVILPAQNESAIWYFGNNAGIDFNYSPPKAIKNPAMVTHEGCSSIADSTGAILFYTDGQFVWNKHDTLMQNGFGLKGDASSTHSSVVVKKPLSVDEYYIITADAGMDIGGPTAPNDGVNYSEVSLQNGTGIVTSKNNPLVDYSSEKIAVTNHRNGIYAWLAIPKGKSKAMYLYLITENGIELKHSDLNFFATEVGTYGQIKFSPNGKLLALLSENKTVVIYDFNNVTGQLTLKQTITNANDVYGLEFSPSGNYLYLSTWFATNKLCQCEVTSGITKYDSCKFYSSKKVSGQLQLGPDQKIYVANNLQKYIGVISTPDSIFSKTGYIDSAITLLPNTSSYLGLPTFHSGYLVIEQISVKDICINDTAYYSINTSKLKFDSLLWIIDKQPTKDTGSSGKHRFNQNGIYEIGIVLFNDTLRDTITRTISVKPLPFAPNLMDTSVCKNDSILMNAYRQPEVSYLWSTTQTDSAIYISKPGTYSVTLSKNNCSINSSFKVENSPFPVINIPDPTIICEHSSVPVSAYTDGATYLWSTSDTTSAVILNQPKQYWVAVTQNRCTTIDTFEIVATTLPQPNLGIDTALCEEQIYPLSALSPYSTYLWNTGNTHSKLQVADTGWYTVSVSNPCGTVTDSVKITQKTCKCNAWAPNAFSPNGDQLNDFFAPTLSCEYSFFELKIYNRWGQQVYHSSGASTQWNGMQNGIFLPSDVYVWHLTCQMLYPGAILDPQTLSGTVTLLR